MPALLPQHDPDKKQRDKELESTRKKYEYDYELIPTVAMARKVRWGEVAAPTWYSMVGQNALKVNANEIENRRTWSSDGTRAVGDNDVGEFEERHEEDQTFFADFEHFVETGEDPGQATRGSGGPRDETAWLEEAAWKVGELTPVLKPPPDPDGDPESAGPQQDRGIVAELLRDFGPVGLAEGTKDFDDLFNVINRIELADDFQNDATVGHLAVAGWNPFMIRATERLPDHFPVTDETYRAVMGESDSLERAGADGRLFVSDYEVLTGLEEAVTDGLQKHYYAPLALYALPEGGRELKPVAIQCDQTPDARSSPIISPSDGWRWSMAKTALSVADANYHELISHLALTHLLVQPFVMATHRHLAKSHPLNRLLAPHFEGTLYINNMAAHNLIAPKGDVDRIFAGTIESSRKVALDGLARLDFRNAVIPRSFEKRGVQRDAVPFYPYRDDALRIWSAIETWVRSYLTHYYEGSNAEVARDSELKTWAEALAPDVEGGVRGLGSLETLDDLVEVVTMVIFTGSAQHAVVNFAQWEMMSYAPATTGAMWARIPNADEPATEEQWVAMLPPLQIAEQQLGTLYQLGNVYYTELGQYRAGHFDDGVVENEMVPAFQQALRQAESEIADANGDAKTRPRSFDLLLPSKIPQSINI